MKKPKKTSFYKHVKAHKHVKKIKENLLKSVIIPPLITIVLLRIYRWVLVLLGKSVFSITAGAYIYLPSGATFASLITAIALKNKWDIPRVTILILILIMYLHDIFFLKKAGELILRPFLDTLLGMLFGIAVSFAWYFLFYKNFDKQ